MQAGITIRPSAFKHGITEADIRNAFLTFKLDMALEVETEKFVLVGFDTNVNNQRKCHPIMELISQ